jgi:hypothetical protein
VRRDGRREVQVDNAGLHDRTEIGDIDLEDARHPCERDDDAALDRDRATGESRASSARNDRHGVLVAEARKCRDVGGVVGEHDRVGRRRIDGAVVLVQQQVFVGAEDFCRAEERDQAAHQRRAAQAGAHRRGGRQEAAPA